MIWQAVRAGFDYFQREAGYTRTGSHSTRVHGRETGQWHEADLAVAHWLQHTSRDGDMQLHVHSQIAHVARTGIDGKWRAPDSLGYNEYIGAVAAIVSQHLEEALTARFGLAWEARDDGHGFEIAGISGEMLRTDGRSVYRRHGGVRFATHAQLTLEQRMVALARADGAPRLGRTEAARLLGADLAQLEGALAGRARDAQGARTRTGLRVDQAAAALSVLTDGRFSHQRAGRVR